MEKLDLLLFFYCNTNINHLMLINHHVLSLIINKKGLVSVINHHKIWIQIHFYASNKSLNKLFNYFETIVSIPSFYKISSTSDLSLLYDPS